MFQPKVAAPVRALDCIKVSLGEDIRWCSPPMFPSVFCEYVHKRLVPCRSIRVDPRSQIRLWYPVLSFVRFHHNITLAPTPRIFADLVGSAARESPRAQNNVRIPTKPARHSNMKPATRSEMKPAMVPI
jgi:hypothetical protein